MKRRTWPDSRAAELLLPLAAGLLIIGISAAVPVAGSALLGLLVLLTLGAVHPGHPWRAGVLAAAPTILASLVTAAAHSLGLFATLLAGSPILVAIYAAAVHGGSLLVAPATEPRAGAGRWRPFETQAQRGRFLVIVALLLVIGVSWSANVGAGEADRAASRRAEEIRGALEGQTAESLRRTSLISGFTAEWDVPGGPYRLVMPGTDRFTATAEVRKRAQARCIHVEVDAAGSITTKIVRSSC